MLCLWLPKEHEPSCSSPLPSPALKGPETAPASASTSASASEFPTAVNAVVQAQDSFSSPEGTEGTPQAAAQGTGKTEHMDLQPHPGLDGSFQMMPVPGLPVIHDISPSLAGSEPAPDCTHSRYGAAEQRAQSRE